MNFFSPAALGVFFGCSELALSLLRRSKAGATADDRGSLRLMWLVITAGMAAGYAIVSLVPALAFSASPLAYRLIVGLFASGILLRWYAIAYLGKYFTVNVAISDDHRVIDTGPYRYVRHPSYSGALLAFLGLGLCMRNFASLLVIVVPVTVVFLRRIRVEEAVLSAALGENYRRYMRHTKRLIPGIY